VRRFVNFVLPGVLVAAALFSLAESAEYKTVEHADVAYLQKVLRRTLDTSFHFEVTWTRPTQRGGHESGDWSPPDRFRNRLVWPGANGYTDIVQIGDEIFWRGAGQRTWRSGDASQAGQRDAVLYALANGLGQPAEVHGDRYTVGEGNQTLTYFVSAGYVTRIVDSAAYDFTLSRFRQPVEITRP
jgi:hypothetical protein